MGKQKTSLAPLISTIVVAALAIVVVIVTIFIITGDNGGASDTDISSDTSFKPTQELVDECTYAAHDLVADNYRVVRLFITEGLPYLPEPYGNLPEDGLYTVNSNEFKSFDQIEELLESVFIKEEAVRVMTDINDKGLSVYKNRETLVKVEPDPSAENSSVQYKKEYVLGISADFVADKTYSKDWSSCRIAIIPRSETLCDLTVYLDGLDETTATEADSDSVLKSTMVKTEQGWRLEKFIY